MSASPLHPRPDDSVPPPSHDEDPSAPSPDDEHDDGALWDPVGDADTPDAATPSTVQVLDEPDPWRGLDAAGPDDATIAMEEREDPTDLWGHDGIDAVPSGVIEAPAIHRVGPPGLAPRRTRARPAAALPTIPWRLAAELLSPAPARLLCTADPRTARTRLLVAAWEWLPGDTPHLRFRLADDGLDVVARSESADEPLLAIRLRIAGRDLDGQALLAADRRERGLVLGRDLLAGRYLIDSAQQEWG